MDFGWALNLLRDGQRVCRAGWGAGEHLFFRKGSVPSCPDSVMHSNNFVWFGKSSESFIPWFPDQTDMLARDWEIAE
jgi:hypothetical protein